jgi:hypothetical protein
LIPKILWTRAEIKLFLLEGKRVATTNKKEMMRIKEDTG